MTDIERLVALMNADGLNVTPEQAIAQGTSSEDTLSMPPYQPLSPSELAIIRAWIVAGAPRFE